MYILTNDKMAAVNTDYVCGVFIVSAGKQDYIAADTDKFRLIASLDVRAGDRHGDNIHLGSYTTEEQAKTVLDFVITCIIKNEQKNICIPTQAEMDGVEEHSKGVSGVTEITLGVPLPDELKAELEKFFGEEV